MKNNSKHINEYDKLNEAISENISRDNENAREYLKQEGIDPNEIEKEWEKRLRQLAMILDLGKTEEENIMLNKEEKIFEEEFGCQVNPRKKGVKKMLEKYSDEEFSKSQIKKKDKGKN